MKKTIIITILLLSFVSASSINWTKGIKNGLAKAKKEHKILMIFIEAQNCPWCAKMLNTTLSDEDVIRNLNKDYINVKVDADSTEGKKYFSNISITPTTYFSTGDKEILEEIDGYNDVEFFFWSMAKAERKFKELK